MTNLLLIAYYFPPLGGAGVGRPLALFRRLPEFGVPAEVLTVKPVAYRHFEPDLLNDLDQSRIFRAGSLDPQRLMYLGGFRQVSNRAIDASRAADRWFPDSKKGWVRSAVRFGRALVENHRIQVVMSTSPPISAHLVAAQLARDFAIPWIADFRDFWTSYRAEDWFADASRVKRARELLSSIVEQAAVVTAANPAIAAYLGAGRTIYNSYDEKTAEAWTTAPDSAAFRIGVLGTVDQLCPVEPLLRLVAKMSESGLSIRIEHVGAMNEPGLATLLERYGLEGRFVSHGLRPRPETVAILSGCSMLYLGLAPGAGDGIVPGRIFDMIASGRPILASVAENGEVARLLSKVPELAYVAGHDLPDGAAFVSDVKRRYESGSLSYTPNRPSLHSFNQGAMVRQFADVIDGISG